jgi:general secretion pathway protein G
VCSEDVQAPKPEIRPGQRHSLSTASQTPRLARQRGFTVVELVIICAIVMTIFAIAIPSLMAAVDQARIARAISDIKAIEDDITAYQTIYGQLPDTLSQVGDDALLDPWGTPYQYLNHATIHGNGQVRKDRFLVPLNSDYDLYSSGKDKRSVGPLTASVSQDDIIRADSGNYVGLASQF